MPTTERKKKTLTISIFIQFIIQIVWVSDRKLLCTPTEEGSPNHPLPGSSLVHPRSHRPIPGPAPQAQRSRSPKADEETQAPELEEGGELSQESLSASSRGDTPPGEPAPESLWEGADRSITVRDRYGMRGKSGFWGLHKTYYGLFRGGTKGRERKGSI